MKKVSLIILLLVCGLKLQSQTSKATIKSWFETGDVPTQTQFWNFIDNSYNEVTDDLLKGQGFPTIKYSPFTVKTPGKIYSGTTNPSSSNRLNYDGYFYATKFYNAAGQEITPGAAVDTANSTTSGLVSPYRYGYWNGKLDRSKYISDTSSRIKVMTRKAVDSLIAISTTGKVSYIGTYNPSGNTFPTTGSGGGTIKKGDYWDLSGSGTLGGVAVDNTMSIISRIDNPGQTLANWDLQGQVVQQAIERKAMDIGSGFIGYTGNTKTKGKFYYNFSYPTNVDTLKFDGTLHPTALRVGGLSLNSPSVNLNPTATTGTAYSFISNIGTTNSYIVKFSGTSSNYFGITKDYHFQWNQNTVQFFTGNGNYAPIVLGGAADNNAALTVNQANNYNIVNFNKSSVTVASISPTGRGSFSDGIYLKSTGAGVIPLYITGNQSGYLAAQMTLASGAFGWGTENASTGGSFYAYNTSTGTGDFYQGWKESTKVFSVDKDGKLTANGFVSNDVSTINSAANGIPLTINNNGTANSLVINSSNSTGQAIKMEHHSTNTSDFISCIKNSAVKASIDHTGKGTFANGVSLSTAGGGNPPLYITGNQSGYVSAQIGLTNGAFGWATANSSTNGSFYAQNTSIGTGDYYQGWKESTKVFSVDKDGKITANGADFGTYTGVGSSVFIRNSSGTSLEISNSGNKGVQINNESVTEGLFIANNSTGQASKIYNTHGGIANYVLNGANVNSIGYYLTQSGAGTPLQIDSASSQRLRVESDGTLVFSGNATVWEDENIDPTTLTGGGSLPTATTWGSTSISAAGFAATGVTQVQGTREIWHKTKLGSIIYPHIHWAANTTNVGVVRWGFEYFFVYEGSGAVTTSTIIYVETTTSGTAWEKINSNFAGITIPNVLGAQLHFRFFRDGSNANDTFTGIAVSETMGYHYEIDQLGSKTTSTK